jgi:hypothetical protein
VSFALESSGPARLDPSSLLGSWRNSDRGAWGGISNLRIREEGAILKVQGYGVGNPEDYEWGEADAILYSTPELSPKAYGFNVTFAFGFLTTDISAYFNNGILVTTTYNVFKDASGRSSYWTREFFHRDG